MDFYYQKNNQNINQNNNLDINLVDYKIPNDYNYRTEYNLTDFVKKLFDISDINDKISHIDLRKQILTYLKDNDKLNKDNEINNIKFKLNDIDKFISAYCFVI